MALTSDIVNDRLDAAKIVATETVNDYLLRKRKGTQCWERDMCKVEVGGWMALSMIGFTPESEVISGTQARTTFTMQDTVGVETWSAVVTSGAYTANYSLNLSPGSASQNATAVANYINSLYPASYPYTASANGANVTISGTHYDQDNGTVFHVTIPQTVGPPAESNLTMSGGEKAVFQENNCITDQEAEMILEGIEKFISPCEPLTTEESVMG